MRVAKTYMQFLFEYLRTISINFKQQKVGNLVAKYQTKKSGNNQLCLFSYDIRARD